MTKRAILWVAVSSKEQTEEEKFSLPLQEKDAHDWCTANGYTVIDVLSVPGHSRWYYTIAECAADMRKEGIDAFDKLLTHIERKDFDVLVCRDADRFGRRLSILSEVVSRVIDSGARIYALSGGWFDQGNHTIQSAMAGYKASSAIDFIKSANKAWREIAPTRGLPSRGRVPFTHKAIRNDSGKVERIVFREEYRQMFDDLAKLILEGVGWGNLEAEMFQRYGYQRKDGKPYSRGFLYEIIMQPVVWGNVASGHNVLWRRGRPGMWACEPGHDKPDNVVIAYGVLEPVYREPVSSQIKAELQRRKDNGKGRKPNVPSLFKGLVYCNECGYRMSVHDRNRYMRCSSRFYTPHRTCSQHTKIPVEKIKQFFDALFDEFRRYPDVVFQSPGDKFDYQQLTSLQEAIQHTEHQIQVMILRQAEAGMSVQDLYARQIEIAGEQLASQKRRYEALGYEAQERTNQTQQRQQVFKIIAAEPDFWQGDALAINQRLTRFCGNYRLFIRDGEIEDFRPL